MLPEVGLFIWFVITEYFLIPLIVDYLADSFVISLFADIADSLLIVKLLQLVKYILLLFLFFRCQFIKESLSFFLLMRRR